MKTDITRYDSIKKVAKNMNIRQLININHEYRFSFLMKEVFQFHFRSHRYNTVEFDD